MSAGSATGSGAVASDSAGSSHRSATLNSTENDPSQFDDALRAGSVDDNAKFLDYLDYVRRALAHGITAHYRNVSDRREITVQRPDGTPILGARVALVADGTEVEVARTQADGRAVLFPKAFAPHAASLTVIADDADQHTSTAINDESTATLVLDIPATTAPAELDIHFLVDTTGSMDDEIARLKQTMESVVSRISALPQHPETRFGLTVYRDHGDDYVSRTTDFTSDVKEFTTELDRVQANGGGDTPEDLDRGFHDAVDGPSWRSGSAVELMFLVADAPPHLNYQSEPDYADDMFVAAEKGISVTPVAASGLDDTGEFIFRQLAQTTLGRFDFLTYGPDGRPGDGTTHHVTGYQVTSLDDLVVDQVTRALAPLLPREEQQ
jgi:hypothetical protein